jgi:hypothetical protein
MIGKRYMRHMEQDEHDRIQISMNMKHLALLWLRRLNRLLQAVKPPGARTEPKAPNSSRVI